MQQFIGGGDTYLNALVSVGQGREDIVEAPDDQREGILDRWADRAKPPTLIMIKTVFSSNSLHALRVGKRRDKNIHQPDGRASRRPQRLPSDSAWASIEGKTGRLPDGRMPLSILILRIHRHRCQTRLCVRCRDGGTLVEGGRWGGGFRKGSKIERPIVSF